MFCHIQIKFLQIEKSYHVFCHMIIVICISNNMIMQIAKPKQENFISFKPKFWFETHTTFKEKLLTRWIGVWGSEMDKVNSSFHSGFRFFFTTLVFSFCIKHKMQQLDGYTQTRDAYGCYLCSTDNSHWRRVKCPHLHDTDTCNYISIVLFSQITNGNDVSSCQLQCPCLRFKVFYPSTVWHYLTQ